MPELPEVETVKEILKKQIIGKTIKEVKVYYEGILENVSKEDFCKLLINEQIVNIERYGKYLFFILNNYTIISHLRMEGKYFIKDVSDCLNKHEHVIFTFSDDVTLRYHDTRKFGKMVLLKTTSLDEVMKYPSLAKLGLEANSPKLDGKYLFEKLRTKKLPIKTALLDQSVIAGLGNIYVDEVCHLCKLHPLTISSSIDEALCNQIVDASHKTLQKAISEGGTTIRSYTSSLGVTGRFQQHLLVHTKDQCFTCGKKVKKIFVGGRGTYFCPNCQKLKHTVVGITGVIASGKSSVVNYLKGHKYFVIDSDLIVKELYNKKNVISKIAKTFGNSYIEDGQINKKELGKLIFNNPLERQKLNDLIHPLVRCEIIKKIDNCADELIFVDIPLLYEAGFSDLCDYVIVVYANELKNIERLIQRDNLTKEEAIIKINTQMPMINKIYLADFIIDNSSSLCYTYERINEIIDMIKK